MSTITGIREARLSDVVSIARIHVGCWREVYSFMPKDVLAKRGFEYRLHQWISWFETKPACEAIFVLEDGLRVVGFAVAKPNQDQQFDTPGEFHACYILPNYRGGVSGPLAMMALANFLKESDLWPACVWAFKSNPYRRIYPALGCKPEVFRDRIIAGFALPEIGYRAPEFNSLMSRLDRMYALAVQRQTESLQKPHQHLHFPG